MRRPSENNAFLAESLREDGFVVDEAVSTERALQELSRRGYDVVISDVGRREQQEFDPNAGLKLARAIREAGMSVPIVFYTSKRGQGAVAAFVEGDARAFMTSSPIQVDRRVRELGRG